MGGDDERSAIEVKLGRYLNMICEDIFYLILNKLPVKTLLRWKCVCKSWKQLFSSKPFILSHLSLQSQNLRPIATNRYSMLNHILNLDLRTLPAFQTLTFPHNFPIQRLTNCAVATHHGIICIYEYNRLLLWNPSICRFLEIPLGFTRTGSSTCAFWIDPSNNEFKVVLITSSVVGNTKISSKLDLFSSKNKTWAEICVGDSCIKDGFFSLAPQVQIDGVAHWVTISGNGEEIFIFFFDFGKDKFSKIELPEILQNNGEIVPCKWQGCLAVSHWLPETGTCDLWVLQNGSWSQMFSFNYIGRAYVRVVCVLESWGSVFITSCKASGTELILYDYISSRSIHLRDEFQQQIKIVYDFVESLIFPDFE